MLSLILCSALFRSTSQYSEAFCFPGAEFQVLRHDSLVQFMFKRIKRKDGGLPTLSSYPARLCVPCKMPYILMTISIRHKAANVKSACLFIYQVS